MGRYGPEEDNWCALNGRCLVIPNVVSRWPPMTVLSDRLQQSFLFKMLECTSLVLTSYLNVTLTSGVHCTA